MIIIDTAPMIALADKGQRTHRQCAALVRELSGTLITTWACFTEALYFLHGLRGWQGQEALWQYVKDQELFLHSPNEDEPLRAYQLMKQYRDTPMDFADASLVVLAEGRGLRKIIYGTPQKLDSQLRCKIAAQRSSNEEATTQNVQHRIQSQSRVGSLERAAHDQ